MRMLHRSLAVKHKKLGEDARESSLASFSRLLAGITQYCTLTQVDINQKNYVIWSLRGGSVTWDSNTKAATVNIDGNMKTYTVGEDGAYIKDNRIYVSGEKFAADFGGRYAGTTGDGVSGYILSINVQVYTTGPRGDKLPASYRHIASVESVTFDNSVAGEKAAGDMNLALANSANYAESGIGAAINAIAGGFGGKVFAIVSGMLSFKDKTGLSILSAPQVHAGYTYVSVYDGYYTTSGGGGGYRYLIIKQ